MPPVNDLFADAVLLDGYWGSAHGSNIGATTETGEPPPFAGDGGYSVWWKWVAPVGGRLAISLYGSTFDTVLDIWTGSSVDNLTFVAGNDDENNPSIISSRIEFTVEEGVTYYIRVDEFGAYGGEIYLTYKMIEVYLYPTHIYTNADSGTVEITGDYTTGSVHFTLDSLESLRDPFDSPAAGLSFELVGDADIDTDYIIVFQTHDLPDMPRTLTEAHIEYVTAGLHSNVGYNGIFSTLLNPTDQVFSFFASQAPSKTIDLGTFTEEQIYSGSDLHQDYVTHISGTLVQATVEMIDAAYIRLVYDVPEPGFSPSAAVTVVRTVETHRSLPVFTENHDGGERVYIDSIGLVRGVKYSHAFPGGPEEMSCTLERDSYATHEGVEEGRRLSVVCGADIVWRGVLDTIDKTSPWSLKAIGTASTAKNFRSYAPLSDNALDLTESVGEAVARGLDWVAPTSLPVPVAGQVASATLSVDEALSRVASDLSTYWHLDGHGNVTIDSVDGDARYLLVDRTYKDTRVLDGFVTTLYLRYVNLAFNVTLVVFNNDAAVAKFGRVESYLDIQDRGPMSHDDALTIATVHLAKIAPHAYYGDSFTCAFGDLITPGGAPVDLATVIAGSFVRVFEASPDGGSRLDSVAATTFVVGRTEYDVDTDILVISPLEGTDRRFTAQLARQSTISTPNEPI